MENVSIKAEGDEHLDTQTGELTRLLAELVRGGWEINFRVVANE